MSEQVETQSDEVLVASTLKEPNDFGLLIERYEAKLQRYIYRLGVRNFEDQQDVLQDIFIKAYRNLNSFDTTLTFSSWLYRVAHNEAISWYRKKIIRPEGHLLFDSEEVLGIIKAKEDSPEIVFDQNVNAKVVAEALAKIEEKYREVLVLRYFEHMEYNEISDILKIPQGSVGTLIHRGKKQLYNALNLEAIRI